MKKHRKHWPWARVLAFSLAALLVLAALIAAIIPAQAQEQRDHYQLTIDLLADYGGARVIQELSYTNREAHFMSQLVFSLQANAYRRITTAPFEEDALSDAYPAGFTPGGVDFLSIKVNGEDADYGVLGQSEGFLRVACALSPGETAVFRFEFDVLLPAARGSFSAFDGESYLSNFFPRAAAYDEAIQDFVLIDERAVGHSLYADLADYSVVLSAPLGYDLAAPGVKTIEEANGRRVFSFEATAVRDMTLVLSRRVREYESLAGSTPVRVLAGNRTGAKRALEIACTAIERYTSWLGAYPFESLDIIQTSALYPEAHSGVIALPESLFESSQSAALEKEISTQIAREWFGFGVGSNPSLEPWLTDALSAYLSMLYTEAEHGHDAYIRRMNAEVLPTIQITLPGGMYVDSESTRFSTRAEYDTVVRMRGCASLHEIRVLLGLEPFLDVLRLYYERGAGQFASIADFASALNDSTNRELDYFLMEMLRSIGDYAGQVMESYE